jgi:hypothetical protein
MDIYIRTITNYRFCLHVRWSPWAAFPLDFLLQRHVIHAYLLISNKTQFRTAHRGGVYYLSASPFMPVSAFFPPESDCTANSIYKDP